MPKQEFTGIPQGMANQISENVEKSGETTCLQCDKPIGYYSLVGVVIRLDNGQTFCDAVCAEEWMDEQDEMREVERDKEKDE